MLTIAATIVLSVSDEMKMLIASRAAPKRRSPINVQRTDQALFTAPVSLTRVVLGKFLGAFVLYAICSAIFLLYAVVISFFATPEWSVILCTFIGLLLFGAALLAINIFNNVLDPVN